MCNSCNKTSRSISDKYHFDELLGAVMQHIQNSVNNFIMEVKKDKDSPASKEALFTMVDQAASLKACERLLIKLKPIELHMDIVEKMVLEFSDDLVNAQEVTIDELKQRQ